MDVEGTTKNQQSPAATVFFVLFAIGAVAAIAVLGIVAFASFAGSGQFSSGPTIPDEWDPVLEPYIDFIESERGLEFEHPVNVRFTDISAEVAADFEAARELEEQFDPSNAVGPFADPYAEAFTLLGLVEFDPDLDSQESAEASIIENAGAFFDPWDQEIVLPEDESILSLQITIVHELTHALQEQNGMLEFHPDTADSSQARLALIEGDAERIAEAWVAQLSEAERQELFDAIGFSSDLPFEEPGNSYLDSTFFVSYSVGVPLVLSIIETDGVEELNRLLRSPDVGSTERFVDLLGESDDQGVNALREFDLPEGREQADGDLGALAWFATLAPTIGTDGAFDALVGYDDDAFAIFENASGTTCARFQVFFDDAAEAAEFNSLVGGVGIAGSVDAVDSSVTAELCESIGNPDDQRSAVVFPLILANELILNHLLMGESPDVARCAALAQAKTQPVDQSLNDFGGFDAQFVASTPFVNACR